MDLVIEKQSKKRKCKLGDEQDQPRNGINNLPREIAVDILSRLPVSSLVQFRYTCQSMKTLSYDPNLVKFHFSRTAKYNPCLIFHSDYPIRNHLYFVDFTNQNDTERVRKIHTPFSAAMPEFDVIGSCNGLLCLSDSIYNDKIYIYNPFTGDYKELPKSLQFQEQEVVFGFGFCEITNEYKVIKIIYYRNAYNEHGPAYRFRFRNYPNSEVQIFSLGSTKWRSIGKAPYQFDRRLSGVLVNGRLHWDSRLRIYNGVRARIIVSFDLESEEFREVLKPDFGAQTWRYYHIAVLGGCLCVAANCRYGNLEIWVMKEYNVKESWVKEFEIGAFTPKVMRPEMRKQYQIWRNTFRGRVVRILCLLKNGEILLEYRGGNLVSYNPVSGTFKDLVFQGMPDLFQTFVHEGSLNYIQ